MKSRNRLTRLAMTFAMLTSGYGTSTHASDFAGWESAGYSNEASSGTDRETQSRNVYRLTIKCREDLVANKNHTVVADSRSSSKDSGAEVALGSTAMVAVPTLVYGLIVNTLANPTGVIAMPVAKGVISKTAVGAAKVVIAGVGFFALGVHFLGTPVTMMYQTTTGGVEASSQMMPVHFTFNNTEEIVHLVSEVTSGINGIQMQRLASQCQRQVSAQYSADSTTAICQGILQNVRERAVKGNLCSKF